MSTTAVLISLIFGINLPWTLSCVRSYIKVPNPNYKREEYFLIAYDILVEKAFIRNSLILQFFSAQGFYNSEYFTLMLLDVVNNAGEYTS